MTSDFPLASPFPCRRQIGSTGNGNYMTVDQWSPTFSAWQLSLGGWGREGKVLCEWRVHEHAQLHLLLAAGVHTCCLQLGVHKCLLLAQAPTAHTSGALHVSTSALFRTGRNPGVGTTAVDDHCGAAVLKQPQPLPNFSSMGIRNPIL